MSFLNKILNYPLFTFRSRKAIQKDTEEIKSLFKKVREQSEDTLKWKERYQRLVETTSDWSWETNDEGKFIWISKNVKNHLGYTWEEMICHYLWEFEAEVTAKECKARFYECLRTVTPMVSQKCKFLHKDGRLLTYNIFGTPMLDDGEVVGFFGCGRDVTDICNSRSRLSAFFKASQDAMLIVRVEDGIILDCNPAICKMMNHREEDIVGKSIYDFSAEPDKTRESLESKVIYVPKRLFKHRDGSLVPFKAYLSYYFDSGTLLVAAILRLLDVDKNN